MNCLSQNETCHNESYIISNNKECIKKINYFDNNMECPKDYSFYDLKNNSCVEICYSIDFFNGKCRIKNYNKENIDKMIKKIQNDLSNGSMDKILLNINDGDKEDLMLKENNSLFVISTSENQKKMKYYNTSTIILGDCENKLREYYNMSDNDPLFIFKIEYYEEGLLIPIIQYEIYSLNNRGNLNMDICKDQKIDILIPVSINEDKLFIYNSSHEFYNDICFPYTSEKGTDIILQDRRNEYLNNNLSLCEKNCEFNGYDNQTKSVKCNCNIKNKFVPFSELEIEKNKLINNFKNIKTIANIDIVKCYKLVFNKQILNGNIGSFIMIFIIIVNIILLFFFIFKGFIVLKKKIDVIAEKDKIIKKQDNNEDMIKNQIEVYNKKDNKSKINPGNDKTQNNIIKDKAKLFKRKKKRKKSKNSRKSKNNSSINTKMN